MNDRKLARQIPQHSHRQQAVAIENWPRSNYDNYPTAIAALSGREVSMLNMPAA